MTGYPWSYGDRPAWLVTHREDLPDIEGADIRRFAGDVSELVARAGGRRVSSACGSSAAATLAAQFLAIDRLDELILTLAPTFVGRGPSLADGDFPLRRFRLASVERAEDTEGVGLRYERLTLGRPIT